MLSWELIAAIIIIATVYAKRDTWFSDLAFVRRIQGLYLFVSALTLIGILVIVGFIFTSTQPPGATRRGDMGDMALLGAIPLVVILTLCIIFSLLSLLRRSMSTTAMQVLLVINSLIMIPVVSFGLIMAFSLYHSRLLSHY